MRYGKLPDFTLFTARRVIFYRPDVYMLNTPAFT